MNGNSFRVYRLGDSGPILFLLHGGGFSGLTWSLFAVSRLFSCFNQYFICYAMVFHLWIFQASVTSMAQCQVLAMDMRGHGNTHTDNDEDLSADTLAK